MAIIVDKVQKKRDIAFACKDLFVQHSLKDLTVSKIAANAGVSKGSIYDYFQNKEEIVFELLHYMMLEHDARKEQKLQNVSTTREKVKIFASFFYSDETRELREIYKDFVAINLSTPTKEMTTFQTECVTRYFNWMCNIIEEGIEKKELIPESIQLAKGLFALGEGLFISSNITYTIENLEDELNQNIDAIFSLIEVKQ